MQRTILNKNIKEKILFAIDELEKRAIEREELIRLAILAIFSKKHMFLIGERGVAKSYVIRLLNNLIIDSKYWELQVGIDTEAKQLFGEKKVASNGTVYYEAKNTILDAHIAFLDEMFKAKSEVLNTLLQVMVDRYYTTGDGRMIEVPLISLFGASNEYPTGSIAQPYLDRLTFWYEVKRIQKKENRLKYFSLQFEKDPIKEPIFTIEEIEEVFEKSKDIAMPDEILFLFDNIVDELLTQGVKTSDRKYLHLIEVMKVCAYLNGREYIDHSELFLFLYGAWHNDIEKRKVREVVYDKLFSNRIYIENLLEEIEKAQENLDTFKNGELFDFLNYKTYFTTNDGEEEFERLFYSCNVLLNKYEHLLLKIYEIKKIKEKTKIIEEMIKKNIFLINYTNETFTPQNLQKLEKIGTVLDIRVAELKEWIEKNPTLAIYKKNAFEHIY